MREKLAYILDAKKDTNNVIAFYNSSMILVILLSMIPLMFKSEQSGLVFLDRFTVSIFIIDYIARWITADIRLNEPNKFKAFIAYPFTPMAIIDMLSIIPSILTISKIFKTLRLIRLVRAFRAMRFFKLIKYSKDVERIIEVFRRQKDSLLAVFGFAFGYLFFTALIMFQIEPDSFGSFFDAIYWATISLTSVGYGDIFAVSTAGRLFTMLSAVMGIAIIALPAGLITAGYLEVLEDERKVL